MKNIIVTLLFVGIIYGCSTQPNESQIKVSGNESDPLRTIKVSLCDTSWGDVKSLLEMDSYVFLSSEMPLGKLKRVIIEKDYVYFLDEQSRLVCFKPNGDIVFSLNNKGKGPGEYSEITDMVINSEESILTIADHNRRKLIHYSLIDGKYLREEDFKVSVSSMAFFNKKYYYYNPFHFNFPKDKSMHFSLLASTSGVDIENRYFPHDPKVADYMYDDNFRQFSYNTKELYFRKRFIDTVFAITGQGLVPRYSIELPDPLPYSLVQQKPDMLELATKSKYSSALHSIYTSGNILHFQFFKDEWVTTAFYDLEKDDQIYCGNHIWPYPTKQLPVYSLIDGVYKGKFFSLASPLTVMEQMERNPEAFPKDWSRVNENSNPVLVFYNLVK